MGGNLMGVEAAVTSEHLPNNQRCQIGTLTRCKLQKKHNEDINHAFKVQNQAVAAGIWVDVWQTVTGI